ncbi:MAG: sulfotransferase [Caldilineaceae bacterium]
MLRTWHEHDRGESCFACTEFFLHILTLPNRIVPKLVEGDILRNTAPFDNSDLWARAAWTRNVEIIFLVGCPRSGTTWLQAMLAAHPAIYTGPETHFFEAFRQAEFTFQHTQARGVGLKAYFTPDTFQELITNLFWYTISALPEPSSHPQYFLEKTPQHCLVAPFILNIFPKARFIHLIRDGRAVVASLLRAGRSWGQQWAPQNAVDATLRFWLNSVQAGRRIADLVPSKEQYIEIKYEALRSDTGGSLLNLWAWLNLPADDSFVRSIVNANSLSTRDASGAVFPSIAQVPHLAQAASTIYPNDFWGAATVNPDEFQLSWIERLWVETLAGSVLRELGYPQLSCYLPLLEKVAMSKDGQRMLRWLARSNRR